MVNKFYQDELDKLREKATSFSKKYPALAPLLAGPSPDPDVERILEGVAYLTGDIQRQLDDGFSEFSQTLINLVFPHYLRPIPSSTIIEYGRSTIFKDMVTVPGGSILDSKKIEGISCRFESCADVDVTTLSVDGCSTTDLGGGKQKLSISLTSTGQEISALNLPSDSLRFFIGGDYPGAADLMLLLMNYTESICIHDGAGNEYFLDQNKLLARGFDPDFSLLEYPSNGLPFYRYFQEYFSIAEKFLFFELNGINDIFSGIQGNQVSIEFILRSSPVSLRNIDEGRFVLHCAPAINLFNHVAEPLKVDLNRSVLKVVPARNENNSYHIYSLEKVSGMSRKTKNRQEYKEIGSGGGLQSATPVYEVSFTSGADVESSAPSAFIKLSYPQEMGIPEKESLAVLLKCTNGHLPAKLRPGDISVPNEASSPALTFKNIIPPSNFQPAPLDSNLLWLLVSHVSLNYLPIANADNLKSLMSLYIFSGSRDKKEEAENNKKIDSITDVQVENIDRIVRGHLLRGHKISVTAARSGFASLGDFYLFGAILESFFSSYASLNSFTWFEIIDSDSGESFTWPEKLGDRPLI